MKKSEEIKARITAQGGSYFANDNISAYVSDGELAELSVEVEGNVKALLQSLVIDVDNDHNTQDTARRVAKMFLREVFEGRYVPCPKVTDFPNAKKVDEIYVVGPITVRSACSHHLAPIMGKAWVGVIPGERVIGLSKFNRVAHWVMSRPQIQEEAVVQLADELEKRMQPMALGVVVKATHFCGCWRGIKDQSEMTTSVMRGIFASDHTAKSELMEIIKGMSFHG
jgi:GTP cyclohydrolase I